MTVTVARSRPVELALWQWRGWRLVPDGQLRGFYRAGPESFEGLINWPGRAFHLRYPPAELRGHPHWPCFHVRSKGWYSVHFRVEPQDVDAGILTIEQILCEALGTTNEGNLQERRRREENGGSHVAQEVALSFEALVGRVLRWLFSA